MTKYSPKANKRFRRSCQELEELENSIVFRPSTNLDTSNYAYQIEEIFPFE